MAREQHTPGPWTTDAEVDDQAVIGPDGVMVADCAIFVSPKFGKRTDATNTANARLIAAAPDMLAALRSINKVASPNPQRTFDDVIRDLNYITDCARSAIAKAGPSTRRDGPVLREGVI